MYLPFKVVITILTLTAISEAAQTYTYWNWYCNLGGAVHDALTNECRNCPAGSYHAASTEVFHAWQYINVPGVGPAYLTNYEWYHGYPIYRGDGNWFFICANGADAGDGNKWTVFWDGCIPYRNGCNGGWSYSLLNFGTCDNHLLTLASISGDGNYGCNMCPSGKYSLSAASSCTDCSTTCPSGQYISAACTRSADRVCSDCPSCPTGQFRTGCSGTSAGSCVSCGSLVANAYYSSDCTWGCNTGYYKFPGMPRPNG